MFTFQHWVTRLIVMGAVESRGAPARESGSDQRQGSSVSSPVTTPREAASCGPSLRRAMACACQHDTPRQIMVVESKSTLEAWQDTGSKWRHATQEQPVWGRRRRPSSDRTWWTYDEEDESQAHIPSPRQDLIAVNLPYSLARSLAADGHAGETSASLCLPGAVLVGEAGSPVHRYQHTNGAMPQTLMIDPETPGPGGSAAPEQAFATPPRVGKGRPGLASDCPDSLSVKSASSTPIRGRLGGDGESASDGITALLLAI